MGDQMVIKPNPIVLVWKFAVIEAAGFLLYLAAASFGNAKSDFYAQLPFSTILTYRVAKMLFLTGAEFAMTVYAFLSWYYEHYVIATDSIKYSRGIFRRKQQRIEINGSTKFTASLTPIGRLFHYGSIHVDAGAASLKMSYISRPAELIDTIREKSEGHGNTFHKMPEIEKLLAENEHERLEFKSSLRFDQKIGQANREVEKAAMKTVAAFLNSKGGYLVLGVNDSRTPLGLENDYQTLQRKDPDGFENHFTQAFNSMIGPEFRDLIKIFFHKMEGRDVCVVGVAASPRPVYLKADNNEQFYLRTGNISTALKLSEIESYSRSRWPQRTS